MSSDSTYACKGHYEKSEIGIVGGKQQRPVHFANWQVVENAPWSKAQRIRLPSAADTAAQWEGVHSYLPLSPQMVQDCSLDGGYLHTPTFLHHDMVMESLNLGMDTTSR